MIGRSAMQIGKAWRAAARAQGRRIRAAVGERGIKVRVSGASTAENRASGVHARAAAAADACARNQGSRSNRDYGQSGPVALKGERLKRKVGREPKGTADVDRGGAAIAMGTRTATRRSQRGGGAAVGLRVGIRPKPKSKAGKASEARSTGRSERVQKYVDGEEVKYRSRKAGVMSGKSWGGGRVVGTRL